MLLTHVSGVSKEFHSFIPGLGHSSNGDYSQVTPLTMGGVMRENLLFFIMAISASSCKVQHLKEVE